MWGVGSLNSQSRLPAWGIWEVYSSSDSDQKATGGSESVCWGTDLCLFGSGKEPDTEILTKPHDATEKCIFFAIFN